MYKAIPYNPDDLECIYIDVRSESEYTKGHIPDAINIPILTDEERHLVGDLYKNVSVDDARRLGLKVASDKTLLYFDEIQKLKLENPRSKVVFYCSRGGYRSTSIALLMRGIGLPVFWISGGYKNYRQTVLQALTNPEFYPKMNVVHGLSGVGKTHILVRLEALGYPVLDLEDYASHKGSHLGQIGIDLHQTQQNFENILYDHLVKLNRKSYTSCFVESESKRIGHVYMPQMLYDTIQQGRHFLIEAELPLRVEILVRDYTLSDDFDAQFTAALKKLTPYTSKEFLLEIEALLALQDYKSIAEKLLIHYYDPLYQKSITQHTYESIIPIASIDDGVTILASWYDENTSKSALLEL